MTECEDVRHAATTTKDAGAAAPLQGLRPRPARRGRSGVFGGSGRVPYIVSMGSPLRAGVRGLGFAGAAPDGLRRAPLRLPLALFLFRVGAAPSLVHGTSRLWRFGLSC